MKTLIDYVGKDVRLALRALQVHASQDDSRPTLRCIFIKNGVAVTTDGVTLIAVKINDLAWPAELSDGLWDFGNLAIPAAAGPLVCEKMEKLKYPDFPVALQGVKNFAVVVEINAGVLQKAVERFKHMIHVRFTENAVEIGGSLGDSAKAWLSVKPDSLYNAADPEAHVALDPALLGRMLARLTGQVRIAFPKNTLGDIKEPVAVSGTSKSGAPAWGVIMPVYYGSGEYWTPAFAPQEIE